MRRVLLAGAAALMLCTACRKPAPEQQWTDASPHTEGFVDVPGGRLNYVDWGGTGPALILIHGMGDNPHAFDDLAPAFVGQFRVMAYARRGHGHSSKDGPFDTATLVGDLTAFMDSRGIGTAHLAGWSMGGNEITAMAGIHPERVGKIVYLDAGYDWADSAFAAALAEWPVPFDLPVEARASLGAFRQWQRDTWFPAIVDSSRIEAYIRGLVEAEPDGSVRSLMSDSVTNQVLQSLLTNHRDYPRVKAPALAIYAATFLDTVAGDSARQGKTRAWEEKHLRPFRTASMARITRELPAVETLTVPGTHADFLFISRDQVTGAILKFLAQP